MNRRLVIMAAFALGVAACGRRSSPRRPKSDSSDEDETEDTTKRPPPLEFERKDEE